MIEKVYLGFIGLIVIVSAASAGVFAACYALFEALKGPLGAAGSAGVVAASIFLLFAVGALLIAIGTRRPAAKDAPSGISGKVMQLARDKPIVAVGALIAAGIVVARNPQMISALVSAFLAGKNARKS